MTTWFTPTLTYCLHRHLNNWKSTEPMTLEINRWEQILSHQSFGPASSSPSTSAAVQYLEPEVQACLAALPCYLFPCPPCCDGTRFLCHRAVKTLSPGLSRLGEVFNAYCRCQHCIKRIFCIVFKNSFKRQHTCKDQVA